jgi:hypothetical protein
VSGVVKVKNVINYNFSSTVFIMLIILQFDAILQIIIDFIYLMTNVQSLGHSKEDHI